MAGTGPKVASTPLELLNSRNNGETSFMYKWFNPLAAGSLGFFAVLMANYATRRPAFSGIHKHVISVAACFSIAKVVDNWRNEHSATRDAILRHYVELHPEDFPPYEKKKYAEVFEKWIPIR